MPFHSEAPPELELGAFAAEGAALLLGALLAVGLASAATMGATVGGAAGGVVAVFFWPSAQAEDQLIPMLSQSRASQSATLHRG